jgi:hypothetical protein
MPSPAHKCMTVANATPFQERVKLALVKTALMAIADENSERKNYARKVLRNEVNLPMAAIAVVANATIGGAITAAIIEGEGADETYGVGDDEIAFAIAEGGDPATGVFAKLAAADVKS